MINHTRKSHAVVPTTDEGTILDVLWRGRMWVVGGLVLGLLAGLAYLHVATPMYQSTAEVYVARKESYRDSSPLDKPALAAASPATHGEIIRTTEVLATALRMDAVAKSRTLAGAPSQLRTLRTLLTIEADAKDEIVRVSVKSPYPDEAALLTNSIVAAYLRLQKQRSQIGGWDLVKNGEAGADAADAQALRDDLPPAAELLMDRHEPDESMSSAVIAAQLSRLGEALTQAEIAVGEAEVRYRTAQEAGDDLDRLFPLAANVLGDARDSEGLASVRIIQNEMALLQRLIDDLPPSWGEQHPRRMELIGRYADLRRRYNDNRHLVAMSLRELLGQKVAQSREHLVEIQHALDETHAKAAKATQLPLAVIEPAQVPEKPASPKASRAMGLAGILGLILGTALAFVQDMRLARRESAQRAAAATPAAQARAAAEAPLADMHNLPAMLADDVPVLGAVPTVASAHRLAAASPAVDQGAASIHQIRAILQMRAAQFGHRAFAFTSPQRGDGRTSVIVGVGTSLAMSGTRTLLVDCDLAGRIARSAPQLPAADHTTATASHPTVDGLLMQLGCVGQRETHALTVRTPIKIGIAGMLDGGSLQQCAVPASVPNLTLLPAVFATPLHIGKLSPAFVQRLIADAAEHYDLILFDTGPIPGSVEALLVAGKCDGAIAIVPPGQSQSGYDKMRAYLKMVGATVLGVIFNRTTGDQPLPDSDLENLGSGILAAAVFSDASAGHTAQDDLDMSDLGDVTAGIQAPSPAARPGDRDDDSDDWHGQAASRIHVVQDQPAAR